MGVEVLGQVAVAVDSRCGIRGVPALSRPVSCQPLATFAVLRVPPSSRSLVSHWYECILITTLLCYRLVSRCRRCQQQPSTTAPATSAACACAYLLLVLLLCSCGRS